MDFRQPKAFGIYKDSDGNFVVYKNKGDGTRAERYRGKDEAYAVNEIYQKLRSEIQILTDTTAIIITIRTIHGSGTMMPGIIGRRLPLTAS